MFVRFVVGTATENPYWLNGVFERAYRLREIESLGFAGTAQLSDMLDWFKCNLPIPPFGEIVAATPWEDRAVCWFRGIRNEPLRRMWPMVKLLEEVGTPVRFITTARPGRILYQDSFQIVAETPGLREQDRRLVPRRCRASMWR